MEGILHMTVLKVMNLPDGCHAHLQVKVGLIMNRTRTFHRPGEREEGGGERGEFTFNGQDGTMPPMLVGMEDDLSIEVIDADDLVATSLAAVPMSTVVRDWCTGNYFWLNLGPGPGDPVKIYVCFVWCPAL